jgi:hypothetical protein
MKLENFLDATWHENHDMTLLYACGVTQTE